MKGKGLKRWFRRTGSRVGNAGGNFVQGRGLLDGGIVLSLLFEVG